MMNRLAAHDKQFHRPAGSAIRRCTVGAPYSLRQTCTPYNPRKRQETEHNTVTNGKMRLRARPVSMTVATASCPIAIGMGRGRSPVDVDKSL
jgi:hypothetical protein